MCGRYALARQRDGIRNEIVHDYPDLNLDDDWQDEGNFVPRYNIAPRTQGVVIHRSAQPQSEDSSDTPGSSSTQKCKFHTMKWGLVPYWSKHEDTKLSTTNARSENLVEGGGMWGSIKGRKRCLIVCQGYYEWLKKGKDKLPHFTKHKDGRLMLLAGLYDCVTLEGSSEPLWTFTIVTTDACKSFQWLHERQPVILTTQTEITTWLDTSSNAWSHELTKLVRPYSDDKSPLECYQVPKEVGKVGTESPSFILPVSQRKGGIESMLSKQSQSKTKSSPIKPEVASPSSSPTPAHIKRESDEGEKDVDTKIEFLSSCNTLTATFEDLPSSQTVTQTRIEETGPKLRHIISDDGDNIKIEASASHGSSIPSSPVTHKRQRSRTRSPSIEILSSPSPSSPLRPRPTKRSKPNAPSSPLPTLKTKPNPKPKTSTTVTNQSKQTAGKKTSSSSNATLAPSSSPNQRNDKDNVTTTGSTKITSFFTKK